MGKEKHNWLDPDRQVIPLQEIPIEHRKVAMLPGGKTQIVDDRYPYRYWPDLDKLCPCLDCAIIDFDKDPSLIGLVQKSLRLSKK